MKLRHALLVSALTLLMSLVNATASPISREAVEKGDEPRDGFKQELELSPVADTTQPLPLPTPLALTNRDAAYRSAYMDVYNILSEQNPCSDFFGGRELAIEALNGLAGQIRNGYFKNSHVGVTMSGKFMVYQSAAHEYSYRLFDKATVNINGPFYTSKGFPTGSYISGVGSFQSNTREARALMLLHELAHIVRKPDGDWLIPDDGNDSEKSNVNTAKIEEQCGQQIKEQSSSAKSSSKKIVNEQAAVAVNKTGSPEDKNIQAGKKQ